MEPLTCTPDAVPVPPELAYTGSDALMLVVVALLLSSNSWQPTCSSADSPSSESATNSVAIARRVLIVRNPFR